MRNVNPIKISINSCLGEKISFQCEFSKTINRCSNTHSSSHFKTTLLLCRSADLIQDQNCTALHCAIRPDIDSIQRSYRDLPITSLPPPPSPPHFLLIFSSLPSHFLLTSSSIFPQFLLTFRLSRISSVDWGFTRTPAGCLLLAGFLADGLPLVAGPWSPGFQARRGLWPRPLHRYHMLHWLAKFCLMKQRGTGEWRKGQH